MATEGAGGLSTTAIERCIDNWADETQDGDEIPAARAELAALTTIAERACAWAAAYAERTTVDPAGYARATVRVARAERALLHALGDPDLADAPADAGPGAAGDVPEGYLARVRSSWRAGEHDPERGVRPWCRYCGAPVERVMTADGPTDDCRHAAGCPVIPAHLGGHVPVVPERGAAGARDETPPGARHPACTSMQCATVGACCYSVCLGPLVEALGEAEGEQEWFRRIRAGGVGEEREAT
jgi:hypothetical protein